jgi:hypothetical protein
MVNRDTLRKINDCQFCPLLVGNQVELIVITMNKTIASKLYKHLSCLLEQHFYLLLTADPFKMAKSITFDQRHYCRMSVRVDRPWCFELILME